MSKFKKKLEKYNLTNILDNSEEYQYMSTHKSFSCDGSLGWKPRTDVFENNEELVVILELAYVEPEDIEIEYNEEFIAIRGYRNEKKFLPKSHFYKMEIDFGPFERIINLPFKVKIHSLEKIYEKGFFIVKIKKVASGENHG
ncbi:MAG: Hsp20/alpha crystallin family protein [Candidatus Delongbacteria bacterium]|nr:Hsp20/alpha crystallin family protein [Candidatus Delongbacteria bacterium]